MLPASLAGAREYLRAGLLDRRVAALAVVAGVPAVVAGAALSRFVDGSLLVALSGVMLFVVGVRMAWPTSPPGCGRRRCLRPAPARDGRGLLLVVGLVAAAGFLTGLLANGGGFLLVPIFVLVLGLTAAQAAGTSMVAVAALIIPTLTAHIVLGHVDWAVAGAFAVGVIPASIVGARLGRRLPEILARRAFGVGDGRRSRWASSRCVRDRATQRRVIDSTSSAYSGRQIRRSGSHGSGRLYTSGDPSRRETCNPAAAATPTGAAESHSY